ncbi:MAG: hypothetical protein JWO02_2622, partial [Solirubrobacterales bacterium]|nr:hypothetical protein [Solirubrobacterales bacterium]
AAAGAAAGPLSAPIAALVGTALYVAGAVRLARPQLRTLLGALRPQPG